MLSLIMIYINRECDNVDTIPIEKVDIDLGSFFSKLKIG